MAARMTNKLSFMFVSALSVAALACAGSADSNPPDTGGTADAGTGTPPPPLNDAGTGTPPPPGADAAPFACDLPASYGDLGAVTGAVAEVGQSMDGGTVVFAILEAPGTPGVTVEIQLWDGYGVFATTPLASVTTPLTVPLTGEETDLNLCGACVALGYGTDAAFELFGATAGTLTLTTINLTPGGTLAGSISGVDFAHVDLGTLEPLADGCATRVDALQFTATVAEAMPPSP